MSQNAEDTLTRSVLPYPIPIGSILIGETTHQSFQIISRIGSGASALAYKAVLIDSNHAWPTPTDQYDESLSVVIKIPHLDLERFSFDQIETRVERINGEILSEYSAASRLATIKQVAQMVDYGIVAINLYKESEYRRINAYFSVHEYIQGVDLAQWCIEHYTTAGESFTGIRDTLEWFRMARQIVEVLYSIHSQNIVHSDVWIHNIIVQPNGLPAFVDFGQAWIEEDVLFRSAEEQFTRYHPYLAPERVKKQSKRSKSGDTPFWSAPADIYSLGGVLFFLATGEDPPSPWLHAIGGELKDHRQFRDEVAHVVAKNNLQLYQRSPGIIDVICTCLHPRLEQRADRTSTVLRVLDLFDEKENGASKVTSLEEMKRELDLLTVEAQGIPTSSNPIFFNILNWEIQRLRRLIATTKTKIYTVNREPPPLLYSLMPAISVLDRGDCCMGVVVARFWAQYSTMVIDQFVAMLRTAALHGIVVQFILLTTERDLKDPKVIQFLKSFRSGVDDFDTMQNRYGEPIDCTIGYQMLLNSEIKHLVHKKQLFFMLEKSKRTTLITPDLYDPDGLVTRARYWADPTREKELRQSFEARLKLSTPINKLGALEKNDEKILRLMTPEHVQ